MVKKLYQYQLLLKNRMKRVGLVIEDGSHFGEIAPLPYFSRETFDDALTEALNWVQKGIEPTLPSVRFGVACTKRPLQSVHVPLCALGPKKGFSHFKLKLGNLSLQNAVYQVRSHLRKAKLRLDFNRKWNLSKALGFASYFKKDDFLYLEEPVQTEEELIEFSHKTNFPIALDESIGMDWKKLPSLRAIVIKPTLIGSVLKIPSHLDLVLSSSYESGLGLVHIANLATTDLPVGLDTHTAFEEDLLTSKISCEKGFFSWHLSEPYIDKSKLKQIA